MSEISQPSGPERTPEGTIVNQAPNQPPMTPEKPTETTPEPGKPSLANEPPKEEPKPAAGAPEKYEDFKVPEGYELDAEVAKEAGDLFKGLGLSQEGAQKLVDFYTAKTSEALEAPFKFWAETQEKWINEVKSSELGSKLQEVKTTISKAIDGLGDPRLAKEFREAMDYTGAGNNLAFIRAFYKLASQVTEASHVPGAGPSPTGQARPGEVPSAAKAMYPNLP